MWAPAFGAGVLALAVNTINVDVMNFRFLWIGFAVLRNAAAEMDVTDA